MSKKKIKRNRRKKSESKEIRDKANGIYKDPNLSCNKGKEITMGIDANLFAKNAKRRCDLDRLYNLSDVWRLKDEKECEEGTNLYESIQVSNMFFQGGLTSKQVLRLLKLNRKASKENDLELVRNHVHYFDKLEEFVKHVGEDTYFVENDHSDDDYYDLLDEYEEFK